MLKGIKFLIASIFAALLLASPVGALSFGALEKISEDSPNIELSTPEEGYSFDATFLDKNQTLSYQTTITNDSPGEAKIQEINLESSQHSFLEYSYSGISVDDVIPSGESRTITLTVQTNSNDTQTVDEDYNLSIDYYNIKPTPPSPDPTPDDEDNPDDNPNTSSGAIKIISIAAISLGAGIFVFARNKKMRHFAFIFALPFAGLFIVSSANAEDSMPQNLTILGKVHYVNTYTVTVNPNGGIYENSSSNTTTKLREGETYHVTEATRKHFTFDGWEVNPGSLDSNNNIEVHNNITIKAKWNEKTYTLTINPNGGKYKNSTDNYVESFRPNEPASIDHPDMEGHYFTGWTVEKGHIGTDGIFNGDAIQMTEDITLVANYEIKRFHVIIDPNGGSFNNSTNVFEDDIDWGSEISLTNTTRNEFELKEWTWNETKTKSADTQSIIITEDTTLVANWWSSIFYDVTINPNGGVYDNRTEPYTYHVRKDTEYTMLEATSTSLIFQYWHYTDSDTHFNETSFLVTKNVSLTAEWVPAVARIERTQKLYPSIMAAHEEANPSGITDDVITLLVDTEEVVTNEKKITLDLNTHTVTGYLKNTAIGNITVVNGEINNYTNPIINEQNPNGSAIINLGTLTIGVDDYENEGIHQKAALISRDNVRLIGNDIGLEQNGHFYFYDGYIEGIIGLDGGYDGSPWFRNTFDGAEIHYFPFVDRNYERNCQHVELENSDRAVSKTIDMGEIYYYNLQDNINTSALTGYDIYAVRDFEATYAIAIPENITTNFDTVGYDIQFGDDWTINGTLNLTNSQSDSHISSLEYSRTIQNNGNFNISGVDLKAISANDLIINSGNINLNDATMSSEIANVITTTGSSATIASSGNSKVSSTAPDKYALINQTDSLTIDGGVFDGTCPIIQNAKPKNLILNDVYAYAKTTSSSSPCAVVDNRGGNVTQNGGSVIIENDDENYNVSPKAVRNYGKYTMTSGLISSSTNKNSSAYGVSNENTSSYGSGSFIMTGGSLVVSSPLSTAYGVSNYGTTFGDSSLDTEPSITVTGKTAYGASSSVTAYKGHIEASSTTGNAYGVYTSGTIKNSGATIIATSTGGNAYGLYGDSNANPTMEGGYVSATTQDASKVAYGIARSGSVNQSGTITVTGGEVFGGTYGINPQRVSSDHKVIIGENDGTLKNGVDNPAAPIISGGVAGVADSYVYFYDGIIRGVDAHFFNMDSVKAIPSGTDYAFGESDEYENACWLITAQNYLHIVGTDNYYNNLDDAYEDVEDGGTIEVIRDYATDAIHPTNTKNITFDLNGFSLTYSTPLKNQGTLTIVDSSAEQTGKISNKNTSVATIENTIPTKTSPIPTLNIQSGSIEGACHAVLSEGFNTNILTVLNITGGHITTKAQTSSNCAAVKARYSTTTIDGGTIEATPDTYVNYNIYGIFPNYGTLTINGGNISAQNAKNTTAIGSTGSTSTTVTINGGKIIATAYNSSDVARGLNFNTYFSTTINKTGETAPEITAISQEYDAYAIDGPVTINDGIITATAKKAAYGVRNANTVRLNGGSVSAYSETSSATGIGYRSSNGNFIMTGGSVSATKGHTDTGTNVLAIGVDMNTQTITGGSVYGQDYGLSSYSSANITLGVNDSDYHNGVEDGNPQPSISGGVYAIEKGYVLFYDGILKGERNYVSDPSIIKSIPTSATYHFEYPTDEGHKHCWLEEAINYLMNTRTGDLFNSLADAYSGSENGDTIEVIADYTTEAVHPENTKQLTLDLHNHTLTYTNPIINGSAGKLTITDLSSAKNGVLQSSNPNSSSPAIRNQGGTVTINNGTIIGAFYAIDNAGGTLTINNGLVKAEGAQAEAAIRGGGTINVYDGEISVKDKVATKAQYGIYANGTINIYGGEVTAECSRTCSGIHNFSSGGTANMYSGTVTVTSDTNNTTSGISMTNVNLLTSDDSSVSAPVITVTSVGAATGLSGNVKIETGTVTVTSTSSNSTGISALNTMSGGTVTATGPGVTYGINNNNKNAAINGGTISAASNSNQSYGVYFSRSYDDSTPSVLTITDANISAYTNGDGKVASGVYLNYKCSANITGGNIYGQTYGIQGAYEQYGANRIITLGTDDGVYNNGVDADLYLTVRGEVHGIDGGDVHFFDGQVMGGDTAYYDRDIKLIPDNSDVHVTSKTIDDNTYEVKYVSASRNTVRIDSQPYPSIKEALNHAQPGDTITLLEDNYVFYPLTFTSEKDVTIELDGYTIVTGNQFTLDSGAKLKIQNTQAGEKPLIDYHESNYLFVAATNSTLELSNFDINTYRLLDAKQNSTVTIDGVDVSKYFYNSNHIPSITSSANLTISNSSIVNNANVINQNGNRLTISNSSFNTQASSASNYVTINNNNAVVEISGTTITSTNSRTAYNGTSYAQSGTNSTGTITGGLIDGHLSVTAGTFSMQGGTHSNLRSKLHTSLTISANATVTLENVHAIYDPGSTVINNSGTLSLKGTTIDVIPDENIPNYRSDTKVISTTKSLTLDNTTINFNSRAVENDATNKYGIYVNGGSAWIENGSNIKLKAFNSTTNYGIYINKSSTAENEGVYLTDGHVIVDNNYENSGEAVTNVRNAYGVYINNGEFTMGEKETDPNLIGTDIANLQEPLIRAIGTTTGIGIYKDTGSFNFYDGKLIGSTAAKPQIATDTEYLYETLKDENGDECVDADGNYYVTLDYIRNPHVNDNGN